MRYAFIKAHEAQHSVRGMCFCLQVHPSGYYAWKAEPQSSRAKDDQRLAGLLRQAWLESGGVYGYRKLTLDMRDLGERCGKHRVARLLKLEGLRSQTGYRRRPGVRAGKPAVVAPNHLQREFTVAQPNRSWVTDITYIRTHEGWLYLAVVVDLFSRQVVGWSMGGRIDTSLVLDALLMALWRRRPEHSVTVHSDQGCQFTGHEWQTFLREHNLVSSMSRRWATATTTLWQRASSNCSSASACAGRSTPRAAMHAPTSLTTSRCSITPSGATARQATLRRSSSNDAIPNGS